MRIALASLALLWIAGCGGPEVDCADHEDDDGDGFVDCDDQDCASACTATTPDGVERCDNAVDDDGDWLVDCDDDDCDPTCDADGDGERATAVGGFDCDDQNAAVSPALPETPYNGLDDDCDPTTPDDDVDGDGFLAAADCDDASAVTFPGAPETCGNGVVDDCDASGIPPRSACFADRATATADATVEGSRLDQRFGTSISAAGDANGDGRGDLLVGADGDGAFQTGAAFLVLGPADGTTDAAGAYTTWIGESEDDWAGNAVAFGGDLDGNGLDDDLAIAARYNEGTGNAAGSVYIVHNDRGPGTFGLDDRVAKVLAEAEYDSAGSAVAAPGDVDGDGFDDLLVGAELHLPAGAIPWGAAYVVRGPLSGDVLLGFADYKFLASSANENAGCSAAGAGDTDGDGRADLLIGSCLYGELDVGIAWHFNTPVLGSQSLTEADGALKGAGPGDHAGTSVAGAGDTDGDGLDDVLVGAPYNDEGSAAGGSSLTVDAGAAYLARGPAGVAMNNPTARLYGAAEGDQAGASVSGAGDLDGDGLADIAIGAPYSDAGAVDGGATFVLFGPVGGIFDLAEADFIIAGSGELELSGSPLANAGDVDADGFDDLLVGAPSANGHGAVHLFTFGY